MIPLGSKLAPFRGVISWNKSNREGRIHFVGKLTQVSDSGPSWPSCFSYFIICHYISHLLLTLYHTIPTFSHPEKEAFWKHCGEKERINQHFLLFPTMFSTLPKSNFNFWFTFILSSANAFNFDQSKILSFGKELTEMGQVTIYPLLLRYSFWLINNRQLLKTLWEKEKLLVTIFSTQIIVSSFVHIFLTLYLNLLLNWKNLKLAYQIKG